ncbi:MAG: hypothetical protein WC545_03840 [Patescibacteria group bacterium]
MKTKTKKYLNFLAIVGLMILFLNSGCKKDEDKGILTSEIRIPSSYTLTEVSLEITNVGSNSQPLSFMYPAPEMPLKTKLPDSYYTGPEIEVDIKCRCVINDDTNSYEKISYFSGLRLVHDKNIVLLVIINENDIENQKYKPFTIRAILHPPAGYTIIRKLVKIYKGEIIIVVDTARNYLEEKIFITKIISGDSLMSYNNYSDSSTLIIPIRKDQEDIFRNSKISFQFETFLSDGTEIYRDIALFSGVAMKKWDGNHTLYNNIENKNLIKLE